MKINLGKQLSLIRLLQVVMILSGLSFSVFSLATQISNENASVEFSGEHAGLKFSGKFEEWEGSIVLPPAQNPSIEVEFDLSTAKTGDFTYDTTLPEGDWFDVENHPKGKFVSKELNVQDNKLNVEGTLTIKNISKSQKFTFIREEDKWVATFPINRLDYNIGLESDPDAEWVSRDINMTITIPYLP